MPEDRNITPHEQGCRRVIYQKHFKQVINILCSFASPYQLLSATEDYIAFAAFDLKTELHPCVGHLERHDYGPIISS